MTYILLDENKEIVKSGNVKVLLPMTSNPVLLSTEELKAQNVYLTIPEPQLKEEWETLGQKVYNYKEEFDEVYSTKIKTTQSLAEFKVTKYKQISEEVQNYIYSKYPLYKQLSATNKRYSEDKCLEINSFCDTYVKLGQDIKDYINSMLILTPGCK